MSPSFTIYNLSNGGSINAEPSSETGLVPLAGEKFSDLENTRFGQLCQSLLLAARRSSFLGAVDGIQRLSTWPKMLWIYARAGIAIVANVFPIWNRPVAQEIRETMGASVEPFPGFFDAKAAVAVRVYITCPNPAAFWMRRFINVLPKSGFVRSCHVPSMEEQNNLSTQF